MVDVNQDEEKSNRARETEESAESFDSANAQPKQVLVTDVEMRNIQRELLEYKDKYLRLFADVENARKRLQKERQEINKYAVEKHYR